MTDLTERLGSQVLELIRSAGRVLPGQLVGRRGSMHLHFEGKVVLVEVSAHIIGLGQPSFEPWERTIPPEEVEEAFREDSTAGRLSRLEIEDVC